MFSKKLTEDAELRILQVRHAEQSFALVDRNRDHLREWLPFIHDDMSVWNERSFIRQGLEGMARDGSFHAGIWYRGELAGVIGFHRVDQQNRRTSIGYFLGEEFQGKGLMTLACKAMVDYAFEELDVNRVEIQVATGNRRSQAIPRRLGFTEEGVLRQADWLYDHFVDNIVFSMLAEEWRELKEQE